MSTQDSGTNAKGRIAIPPPGKIRKTVSSALNPFFRIVVSSLLTLPEILSAPIRNSGIINLPPPLGGIPPGIPPGAIGLPGQPVFFPPVRISVDPSSQLYVPPGSDGRIVITLRNDGAGDVFYVSGGDDKNFFLQFDYSQ